MLVRLSSLTDVPNETGPAAVAPGVQGPAQLGAVSMRKLFGATRPARADLSAAAVPLIVSLPLSWATMVSKPPGRLAVGLKRVSSTAIGSLPPGSVESCPIDVLL